MNDISQIAEQQRIIIALKVARSFNAQAKIEFRTVFLRGHLMRYRRRILVQGISGGVDSLAGSSWQTQQHFLCQQVVLEIFSSLIDESHRVSTCVGQLYLLVERRKRRHIGI